MPLFQHIVLWVILSISGGSDEGPPNKSCETKVQLELVPSAERRKNEKEWRPVKPLPTLAAIGLAIFRVRTELPPLGNFFQRMFVGS